MNALNMTRATVLVVLCAVVPAAAQVPQWTAARTPSVVIGEHDFRPGHALYLVRLATRLADGRIATVDRSSEVRFFSETGQLLGVAGGPGGGPDEFRMIYAAGNTVGDTIVIVSMADGAISRVSPSKEVSSKVPLDITRITLTGCTDHQIEVLPDASLLVQREAVAHETECRGPQPDRPHRHDDWFVRYDPRTDTSDTLAILPGREYQSDHDQRIYGRSLQVAASRDRIHLGDTGSDSILVLNYAGERVATFRHPLEAEPIPDAIRSNQPDPIRDRSGAIRVQRRHEYPETFPRHARMLTDHAGNLWVQAYVGPQAPPSAGGLPAPDRRYSGEWTVLDRDGRVIATARTPPGLRVVEIGADYVLGIARNEMDVEIVYLYALSR